MTQEFPILLKQSVQLPDISSIKQDIVRAIDSPPFDGRNASSKSFSFLLINRGDFSAIVFDLIGAFWRSKLHVAAVRIFGEDYAFMVDNCSVRRHRPNGPESALTLHFDGMFLGGDKPSVNFWVPLDDVGETLPGLSFISNKDLERHAWDRYQAKMDAAGWRSTDPNLLDKMMPSEARETFRKFLFTPKVHRGDALLFGAETLHATQDVPDWQGERVSVEFRVAKSDAIPLLYARRGGLLAKAVGEGDNGFRLWMRDLSDPTGKWGWL